jgi:hypothetical protein
MTCAAAASEVTDPEVSGKGWLEREVERAAAQVYQAAMSDENKRFSSERFEDELFTVLRFARERAPFVAREASRELARMSGFPLR